MATINITVLPSRVNLDGSYTIRIALTHSGKTSYIASPYSIENLNQWKNNRVVGRDDASVLNLKLRNILNVYQDRIDSLPDCYMTCNQVRDIITMQSHNTVTVKDYVDKFIKQLLKEKRISYKKNIEYTFKAFFKCIGEDIPFLLISPTSIKKYDKYLRANNQSDTTINIRMSHIKAIINYAIADGIVRYNIHPFNYYTLPEKNIRDICISIEEFSKLRDAEFTGVSKRRLTVARDLFLLSFYCAGINLTDLLSAKLDENVITFIRKKTAKKKKNQKEVSLTLQPEAKEIIKKYISKSGKLSFGYRYANYEDFRCFVTKSLNKIGRQFQFEKPLMYYSARKTFCQIGYEIGVPLYILEYAIGQTIKEAHNRPIFNYIKIMRSHADDAIRKVIDCTRSEAE